MHCEGEHGRGELAFTETASSSTGSATYVVKEHGNAAGEQLGSTAVETWKPAKKLRQTLDDSDAEAEEEFEEGETNAVERGATGAEAPAPSITIPAETRSTAQLAMERLRERVRQKQRLAEARASDTQRHGDVATI